MEATILQQDIMAISQAVRGVIGYGIEEVRGENRTPAKMMPAKSAICYYLAIRGHSYGVLAEVFGLPRPDIYYLLRRHAEMLFAEPLYRRCVEKLDSLLISPYV